MDMRIVDDAGAVLPHDGKAYGDLQVRGPHVISRYYRVRSTPAMAPLPRFTCSRASVVIILSWYTSLVVSPLLFYDSPWIGHCCCLHYLVTQTQ